MRSLRERLGRWIIGSFVPSVFPRVNPLTRRILRSRLHFLLDWNVILLRYEGRRTGRSYETPVSYRRGSDGVLQAATSGKAVWWRNLQGVEEIQVVFKGRSRRAGLEILQDEGAIAQALRSRDMIRRALMPVSPSETVILQIRILPE